MKFDLIHNWREAWRWISMWAMAANVAFLGTWAALPDDLKTALPSWIVPTAAVIVLVIGMAGRLIKQEPKQGGQG